MSVRDFDKALQEKAQSLRLQPSPQVWAGVAEELNRKRRRRGVAWIFTAAALVAGLAVSVIGYQQYKSSPAKELAKKAGLEIDQAATKYNITETLQSENSTTAKLNPTRIDQNATLTDGLSDSGNKKSTVQKTGQPVHAITVIGKNAAINESSASIASTGKNKYLEEQDVIEPASNEIPIEASEHQVRPLLPAAIRGLVEEQNQPLVKASKDLVLNNQLAADLVQTKKIKKPDTWHTAILFGAGAGSMVESGLQQYNSLANEYLGSVNIPSGIAAIQQRPSDVKSGPAFHLGAQVSKRLTSKLSLGIGLQYAYVSNQITVGNSPDSTISIYNDRQQLITNSAAYKAAGNSGSKFYNQFHFIQLPLEFSIALGSKQKWHYSAGAGIGYLLGMHALQYNNQAGVYYKDNAAYNKWQTTIFTGFQYRFSKANKIPFQVGPFAQYQLSSLDKTNTNKHLLVYGLAAKFQIR